MTLSADGATVRLLISDLDADPVFTDAEIEAFLALEGPVKLAAAQALDTMASNEAMVSKKIRTLDLQTDGPAVAASLRASATELRRQYYEDGPGEFEVSTTLGTPHFPFSPELTEYPYLAGYY